MGTPSIGRPSAGSRRLRLGHLCHNCCRSPGRAPLLPFNRPLKSYLGSSRRRVARYLSFPRVTRFSLLSMAPLPTVRHPLAMHHDLSDEWPSRTARSLNGSRTDPVGGSDITTAVQPPRGARKFAANITRDSAAHLPIVPAAGSATGRLRSLAFRHNTTDKQSSTPVTSPDTRQPAVASGLESPNWRLEGLFHIALDPLRREAGRAVPSLVPASTRRRPAESVSPSGTGRQGIAAETKLGRPEAPHVPNSKPWHADLTDRRVRSPSKTNREALSDAQSVGQIAGATLHLDGAALGRWAVQHIERALARPSNGMTGVDPRATMPRGHISPF